ncbi:MAG: capsule assembly Wzi family protein [Bacteroidales bacterium]|nr:capsule assembly Wzi family protein [Bacteroidales bacterium]
MRKAFNLLLFCAIGACAHVFAQTDAGADSVASQSVIDSMRIDPVVEKPVAAPPEKETLYRYKAEAMASFSSGHTPFWIMNNRYGLSSLERNNGYVRGAVFKDMSHRSRFSWGFGADIVVPYNFTSKFVIQQLYAEMRYRSLELAVGSKERYTGVVNQELGSGDLVFSQNARPVPQVHLSMPEYENIPGTDKWLAAKGFFSIGMFSDWRWQRKHVNHEDGRWGEKIWYSDKGLFLRVGDPDRHQLTVEGGLEMGTQLCGTVYYYKEGQKKTIKLPHDFKNVIKGLIGLSGGDPNDPQQYGERNNAYGNTIGEWSVAATYRLRDTGWKMRVYYQHMFEDHSMMFFNYKWRDMLLGGEVTLPANPFVSQVVYEFLYTKDQSGPVFWNKTDKIPEQVSGRDDYYNNSIYPGWQHWGMGMGNPLVISPIYNDNNTLSFLHNRIIGHHIGFSGDPCPQLHYRLLMSYTRSWGSYNVPAPHVLHNFNCLLETTYSPRRLPGWDFRLSLAADGGRLLGKSYGTMLTIRKTGWIK